MGFSVKITGQELKSFNITKIKSNFYQYLKVETALAEIDFRRSTRPGDRSGIQHRNRHLPHPSSSPSGMPSYQLGGIHSGVYSQISRFDKGHSFSIDVGIDAMGSVGRTFSNTPTIQRAFMKLIGLEYSNRVFGRRPVGKTFQRQVVDKNFFKFNINLLKDAIIINNYI